MLEREFLQGHGVRVSSHGFKLKDGRFRLDLRKRLFTGRVVRHWNRFHKDVVNIPFLLSVRGQIGWGFEQRFLVEIVPACGWGVGSR